jgi:hypothetical protein
MKALAGLLFCALAAWGQTSSLTGEVKGEDGKPLKDAWIKIDRTDIKGHYQVKTNKKGEYFHAGLPLGFYTVTLEVDGKVRDQIKGVKTSLGDPKPINFDLQASKKQQDAQQAANGAGTLTKEQESHMSPEEKAKMEKALKEREASLQKNKALNESFTTGMDALKAQKYDDAVTAFTKASEMDAKQHVVWANLAESYFGQAKSKTGDEQMAIMTKGFAAYKS